MGGQNIGDLLNQRRRHLGLVPGRLRQPELRSGQPNSDDLSDGLHGQPHNIGGATVDRLHPPPRAVPVLRLDRQPEAPAADLGRDDRPSGPGQPPVRPEGLLGGGRRRQPARRVLPQGARVPGRPRRVLGSARRAEFLVETINHLRSVELEEHRGGHPLRRLRRLVRPPDGADPHPVADAPRRAHRSGHVRDQPPPRSRTANRPAVASARGSRCWSSRRSPSATSSTARHDQSSVVRFIEDNWLGGQRIGGGSNDAIAGTLDQHVQFDRHGERPRCSSTRAPASPWGRGRPRAHGDHGRRHR